MNISGKILAFFFFFSSLYKGISHSTPKKGELPEEHSREVTKAGSIYSQGKIPVLSGSFLPWSLLKEEEPNEKHSFRKSFLPEISTCLFNFSLPGFPGGIFYSLYLSLGRDIMHILLLQDDTVCPVL